MEKRVSQVHSFSSRARKRGSHVEIVLSFAIFILFLIFLYPLLIEPAISTEDDKSFFLDDTKNSIIENISSNVTVLTFNSGSASGNCINLNNFFSVNGINSKIVVEDYYGNNQNVRINGSSLQILRTNTSETFFKIYNSEDFASISNSVQNPCSTVSYTQGLTKEDDFSFEKKIIFLVESYNKDYESLKSVLGLSGDNEFDFTFSYQNGTIVGIKKDITSNIFADETQIEYFNTNGNLNFGKLNIRVY